MIALDTNILVRYFTQDDPKQAAIATQLIERQMISGGTCFISLLVLGELIWVLAGKFYGYNKPQLVHLLRQMTTKADLAIEHPEVVILAVEDFAEGTAQFQDYLIIRLAQSHQASVFYTFDKKAAHHSFAQIPV